MLVSGGLKRVSLRRWSIVLVQSLTLVRIVHVIQDAEPWGCMHCVLHHYIFVISEPIFRRVTVDCLPNRYTVEETKLSSRFLVIVSNRLSERNGGRTWSAAQANTWWNYRQAGHSVMYIKRLILSARWADKLLPCTSCKGEQKNMSTRQIYKPLTRSVMPARKCRYFCSEIKFSTWKTLDRTGWE